VLLMLYATSLQAIDAVIQRLGDTLAAGVFEVLGEVATQQLREVAYKMRPAHG
jgi:hypothetical protein